MNSQTNIRNFAIIAHIDHGKSTLADRLLEITGTVSKRDSVEQILDSNPIERERGITIKLAPVRMRYKIRNPKSEIPNKFKTLNSNNQNSRSFELRASNFEITNPEYILNLIDTPGHVDFSYEVSRSLAACEGVILVVDATQGIQAQTLAHMNLVKRRNLVTIPVINKIDLPQANIKKTKDSLSSMFGFQEQDFIAVSSKTGENVELVLDAIVNRIPAPTGKEKDLLRALVFSSQYDSHKGVVVFVRIVDGNLNHGEKENIDLIFMASKAKFSPIEVGYFIPRMNISNRLATGEVGFIATGLKDSSFARVGDTITISNIEFQVSNGKKIQNTQHYVKPLPGYKEPKPMVFYGIFPIDNNDFLQLRDSLEKLNLSDSAFTFRPTSSAALGNGFHCGFLGLLHADVVLDRLENEYGVSALSTVPSVEYKINLKNGKEIIVQRAEKLPDPTKIDKIFEPLMIVSIYSPKAYVGSIMRLCKERRGIMHDMNYLESQVKFSYTIPLSEMIVGFFDRLKSVTEGYASMDYELFSYDLVDAVKLSILVNREEIDALATIVVKKNAQLVGRRIVEKLKKSIPRQQFEIPLQAAIGGNIIARETISAYRKDVTAKLYGGDRTRKDKLLKKQKKGKAKMKMIGKAEIPQSAFLAVLQ